MKIAKVLFKIAHELDKSGRPDLADAADSLAVKLANSPSQYTSVTDIDLTKIPTRPATATRGNKIQRAVPVGPPAASEAELKEQQRLIDEKRNKSTAVKKKEMAERKARGAARKSALNPAPKATVKPSPAGVDFGRMDEIKDLAKRDRNQIKPPLPKRLDTGPDLLKQPAVKSISIQDAASRMKSGPTTSAGRPDPSPLKQPAVKSISIQDAASKMKPGPTTSLQSYRANPANSWTRGLKPGKPSAGAGLLGGAVGGHAGAAIGKAVGGETGQWIGGTAGTLVGSAIAQFPVGKALLAGWAIGTVISKHPVVSEWVQGAADSVFGNEDAGHDELQLKGMLAILGRLQQVVDNKDLPLETRAKKLESLRGLITSIANHPAAKDDLVKSMSALGAAIDADIAAAPKADPVPTANTSPADVTVAPAAKAPRRIQPSAKISNLQANLNKLIESGRIDLSESLVVDGIVGRRTREAILAFDPESGGRVTTELIEAVASAASTSPAGGMPLTQYS